MRGDQSEQVKTKNSYREYGLLTRINDDWGSWTMMMNNHSQQLLVLIHLQLMVDAADYQVSITIPKINIVCRFVWL